MENKFSKQPLLNVKVNNLTSKEALDCIESLVKSEKKSYVVAVNVDVIVKNDTDPYLNKIIGDANIVLVDGMPLVWFSKITNHPIIEKVSGSDIVPLVCKLAAKKGYSLFILGGKSSVLNKAKENLEHSLPSIKIVGTYSPPIGFENNNEEIKKINEMINLSNPDFLIVCLGCPKQEKWIYENYLKYNAKVSICAGATIDFLAGNIKRAPSWISKIGLEWFYRFMQEPKRLFKRYFIDDLKIFKICLSSIIKRNQ